MRPGNLIFVYMKDGESLLLTYLGDKKGFLVFEDHDGNLVPLRPSSISSVRDTERAATSIKPLKLKIKGQPVIDYPPVALSESSRGRLHL